MLNGIRIKERATEKTMTVEPVESGSTVMVFFFHNHALEQRMHIVLSEEDLKVLASLLQLRLAELEGNK